jgi:hypothetical protein
MNKQCLLYWFWKFKEKNHLFQLKHALRKFLTTQNKCFKRKLNFFFVKNNFNYFWPRIFKSIVYNPTKLASFMACSYNISKKINISKSQSSFRLEFSLKTIRWVGFFYIFMHIFKAGGHHMQHAAQKCSINIPTNCPYFSFIPSAYGHVLNLYFEKNAKSVLYARK